MRFAVNVRVFYASVQQEPKATGTCGVCAPLRTKVRAGLSGWHWPLPLPIADNRAPSTAKDEYVPSTVFGAHLANVIQYVDGHQRSGNPTLRRNS